MKRLENQAVKDNLPQEPYRFKKRLGSTIFLVNVHSSETNTESAKEKIARIIRNDVAIGKVVNL